jgi:hypothetical protein
MTRYLLHARRMGLRPRPQGSREFLFGQGKQSIKRSATPPHGGKCPDFSCLLGAARRIAAPGARYPVHLID